MAAALQPPESFQCAAGPRFSILCSWAPPQQGKVFVAYSYRLYMKKASEAQFTKVKEFKDVFEHVLRGLEPNTEYQLQLMSFTANRVDGPCAPVVAVRTGIAGPSVAPTNLRESFSSLDTLEVTWDLPAAPDPVVGFRIFMDEEGKEEYVEETLPASARTFRIGYLRMDTPYRFQVLAFNDAGEGPMSDIVCVRTQQDAVSRFLQKQKKPGREVSQLKRLDIRGEHAPPPVAPTPEPEPEPEPVRKPNMPFVPSCERRPRPAAAAAAPEPAPEPEPTQEDPEEAERRRRRESKNKYVADLVMQSELALVGKKLFTVEPPTIAQKASVVTRGAGVQLTSAQQMMEDRLRQRREMEAQIAADGGGARLPFLDADQLMMVGGTIRGKKNAVRAVLSAMQATKEFESELLERIYHEEKDGKIVVYVTSVQAVRKTYDDCRAVLKIFETMRKKVQVKDIALDGRFIAELEERMHTSLVPQVFVNSIHIGDMSTVVHLNDNGDLAHMLAKFEPRADRPCGSCGGVGYRNCSWCQGSKKSIAHQFGQDPRKNALKCTVCNENGLERCPNC